MHSVLINCHARNRTGYKKINCFIICSWTKYILYWCYIHAMEILLYVLWKESLNNGGQHFHQCQQNENPSFLLKPFEHKKRTTPSVGNPDTGLRQTQKRSETKVRVTRSLVLCVCFVDRCMSFCTFSFGYFVVCSS